MRFLLLIVCLFPVLLYGQRHNFLSRSELGFLAGGSYYIGDLNQTHFQHTKPAGGLIYRFNVHSRLSLRANLLFGSVQASDAESHSASRRNRNLSFQSKIAELGAGVEFSYLPFQLGHSKYKGTAYILAEFALAKINPMADYNGQLVALRPLGTEGQGTSESSHSRYMLTQLTIPIGAGAKFSIGEHTCIYFEYGIRFMFTDYLDDVGGSRYADPTVIANQNGPMAAALSNRSLDGNRYGQRGNPVTRDWYAFFGAGISFRLGRVSTCWH